MRLNSMFKIIAVFIILVFTSVLASCTKEQEEYVWENEGKSKAFLQTTSGIDLTLNNRSASYYINGLTGDYKTAAQWAVTKANTTSSQLTINTTTSSTSDFLFATYSSSDGKNGLNTINYSTATGYISRSTIQLNTYYLSTYTLDGKKHIAVHEMGHTLGLRDINTDVLSGHTIMWYSYSGSTTFDNYQRFDLENIKWKYGL